MVPDVVVANFVLEGVFWCPLKALSSWAVPALGVSADVDAKSGGAWVKWQAAREKMQHQRHRQR